MSLQYQVPPYSFVPLVRAEHRASTLSECKAAWDAIHTLSQNADIGTEGQTFLNNTLVPLDQFSMEVLGRLNEDSGFLRGPSDVHQDIHNYSKMPRSTLICEEFNNVGRTIASHNRQKKWTRLHIGRGWLSAVLP